MLFVIKDVKIAGGDPFYEVPRSFEHTKRVGDQLKALLASLLSVLGKQFVNIRKRTTL